MLQKIEKKWEANRTTPELSHTKWSRNVPIIGCKAPNFDRNIPTNKQNKIDIKKNTSIKFWSIFLFLILKKIVFIKRNNPEKISIK